MTHKERKEILRRLMGRMPRIFGGSGCACSSCKATNRLRLEGFDKWPKGNPAGSKSKAEYSAHANLARKSAATGMTIGPAGIGFYGVPVGSRADAERILAASFQECAP